MVIITGVSSGIGKALALDYLKKGEKVIGIGRTNVIEHANYRFQECDFNKPEYIADLHFDFVNEDKVVLVNNAGVVGNIERLSEQDVSDVKEVITVNTIAPMLLTQRILRLCPIDVEFVLINISSGAGKRAIPSWASYCASKAALDLFSQTVLEEELERSRNIKVYSVSPGVVDTSMQEKIRSSSLPTFSSFQSFIDLKQQNKLDSPENVVEKLNLLLQEPYKNEVLFSLRDY